MLNHLFKQCFCTVVITNRSLKWTLYSTLAFGILDALMKNPPLVLWPGIEINSKIPKDVAAILLREQSRKLDDAGEHKSEVDHA